MSATLTTATADPPTAQLLDVRAVAALLDCSPRHVYRLSDAGKMPLPLRIGSLVRWQKSSILTWLDAGCPTCKEGRR